MCMWGVTTQEVGYEEARIIGYHLGGCLSCRHLSQRNKNKRPQKHYTRMFVGVYLQYSNWKQPRCSSAGVWINKLVYSHSGFDSAIKRNQLLINTKVLINLKNIILSKRGKSP